MKGFWTPPIAGWCYFVTELNPGVSEYSDRTVTVRCTQAASRKNPYACIEVFSNSQELQCLAQAGKSLDECARFITERINRHRKFLDFIAGEESDHV